MPDTAKTPRGWELSTTCMATTSTGNAAGRKRGLEETGANSLARVLGLQARDRFGDLAAGKALLDALAAARAVEPLKQLGASLLQAAGWEDWLAGMEPPPPAPNDFPEFCDDDPDFESEKAYIDMTAKVTMKGGEKGIVHIRLQKWYQPDLGEVLFKAATRLKRQFGIKPMVIIILMWPSADGPAVTGFYKGTDWQGRQVNFRYEVRRAWEMPPDEMLASPGTMMFVPLAKGAKERMPELVRSVRDRIAQMPHDQRTVDALWASFYWAMGSTCTLEEAHAYLGDLLPVVFGTTDYKKAYGKCFWEGYSGALPEGPVLAVRELVGQQARLRFGDDSAGAAALERVSSLHALEAIARRVFTAAGWADLVPSAA